jgi:DTW domain-containing protein YfiP
MHQLFCFCQHLVELKSETFISLIVHQKEYYLPSTTSYYTNLILPETSEILLRGVKDSPVNLEKNLKIKGTPLVLFPDEDAQVLNEEWIKNNPGPYHLIVPDGTWNQAKKVCKREEVLRPFKKVVLEHNKHSQYYLRKAPSQDKLCTMESIIMALSYLESDKTIIDKMDKFFNVMVEHALRARSKPKKKVPKS